ncbi:MAG: hypothetical protein IKM79_02635 [Bacteroidales bacterium]|nr:hypothetical protein [Bacteroidales bacterium]
MKTIFTVLAFMLFMFFSLYRNVKKQMGENSRPQRKSWWKEIASDEESDAEAEPAPSGVDGLGEPYFSYEYEEPSVEKKPKPAPQPQPSAVRKQPLAAMAVEAAPAPAFDLRQAVIYKMVLDNPYISEISK